MPNRENSARVSHILGNYEIFDELGRGGMGIVYRGLDLSLDRPVAVKVLRDDLRMQSMIVNRFAREARAAASLDHPNIVQIYSVGEAQRTPYIAMELVDSEPLSALMIREGRLPWERAFAIASQVAAALMSAHDAQIIHRDVKPPNILLTERDKAYVTDFGIAKILSMHDQLTLDGTKLGTPQYMSPERCKSGDASASSDLYSLGVLLFQMISGRLPHEGASATELVRRILSQPPARLRAFVPDVPEDVERMVAWLIEARPENRPASAMVAQEAIDRVRAGQRLDIRSSAVSRAIADFRGDSGESKRIKAFSKRGATPKRSRSANAWVYRWMAMGTVALFALVAGWGIGAALRADEADASVGQQEIANWYVPKNAASFLREAEHIWIAHLANPDHRIGAMAWSAADQSFLLLTDGVGAEATQVRRAVLAVNPAAQFARAVVPRVEDAGRFVNMDMGTGVGAGFVGASMEFGIAPTATWAAHDATWFQQAVAGVVGASRVGDVVRCAFHPIEPRMLLVVQEPGGGQALYEQALGVTGAPLASAQAIEMVAYTNNGAHFFYAERGSDEHVGVYMGDISRENSPVLLWQGATHVSAEAIQPDGASIVVEETGGELTAVPLLGSDGERLLGEGRGGVWIDNSRLAVVAPDTRGTNQIWEVSSIDGVPRRQLSFIDGGVEVPLCVSSDGRWIAAIPSTSEHSAVLLLQLTSS